MNICSALLVLIAAISVVNGVTLTYQSDGRSLGADNAIKLTISVDNSYTLYWNGEIMTNSYSWPDIRSYTLIPKPQCGYRNVLAILAWGDRSVDDGAIFEVKYGDLLYQSGNSSEIKVGIHEVVSSESSTWYSKPCSNKLKWADSDTRPICNMFADEMTVKDGYFSQGTRWIWWNDCTSLTYASVDFKLVVETQHCTIKHRSCDSCDGGD